MQNYCTFAANFGKAARLHGDIFNGVKAMRKHPETWGVSERNAAVACGHAARFE
jgi:hypothetical protein